MYIEQIYTSGLRQAGYYIESDGEAAFIDPVRGTGTQWCLELARKRNSIVKYVFLTHLHNDFLCGHLDVHRHTGATVIIGPGALVSLPVVTAPDDSRFQLGNCIIQLLHTPGHTAESVCYLLLDGRFNPHSVFTGDTLFVGEVGRTDQPNLSAYGAREMAGRLYDSIHRKLMVLPPYVVLYPGHGPGWINGKAIGTELHTTIGIEKKTNYALKINDRDQFIQTVTEGSTDTPSYFTRLAALNSKGPALLDTGMIAALKPVSVDAVHAFQTGRNEAVLDVRSVVEFRNGFIPGSIFLGLDGAMEQVAANIIDPKTGLLILTEPGKEQEVTLRLAAVGIDNICGFLKGGFNTWLDAGEKSGMVRSVTAKEFEHRFRYNGSTVLDVRNFEDCITGIVAGARLIPLTVLERNMGGIDPARECYVYCANDHRSMTAVSLLLRHGYKNAVQVSGGFSEIRKTSIPLRQLTPLAN